MRDPQIPKAWRLYLSSQYQLIGEVFAFQGKTESPKLTCIPDRADLIINNVLKLGIYFPPLRIEMVREPHLGKSLSSWIL